MINCIYIKTNLTKTINSILQFEDSAFYTCDTILYFHVIRSIFIVPKIIMLKSLRYLHALLTANNAS